MNRTLFPLSLCSGGERLSGSLHPAPSNCRDCIHRECENLPPQGEVVIQRCREGLHYTRSLAGVTLFGFRLVSDIQTSGKSRRARDARPGEVDPDFVRMCAGAADRAGLSLLLGGLPEREQTSEVVREVVAEKLDGLSQSTIHDLMQLLAAAKQNVEYVLMGRYGQDWHSASSTGQNELKSREAAAYHMLDLATLRLSATEIVTSRREGRQKRLSVHGMFTKILRPYAHVAASRGIRFQKRGHAYGQVLAVAESFSIPPLAVVDNAVKYSPNDQVVEVDFDESQFFIRVALTSFGPLITPGEREQLFRAGFRGEAAEGFADGSGLGLWMAHEILSRNDAELSIEQDRAVRNIAGKCYYRTRVTIRYAKADVTARRA